MWLWVRHETLIRQEQNGLGWKPKKEGDEEKSFYHTPAPPAIHPARYYDDGNDVDQPSSSIQVTGRRYYSALQLAVSSLCCCCCTVKGKGPRKVTEAPAASKGSILSLAGKSTPLTPL